MHTITKENGQVELANPPTVQRLKRQADHTELASFKQKARTSEGRAFFKRWKNFLHTIVCHDEDRYERGSADYNQTQRDIAFSLLGQEPTAEQLRILPQAYRAITKVAAQSGTFGPGSDEIMPESMIRMKVALQSGLPLSDIESISSTVFDRMIWLS
jgi:hypothetical protein